MTGARTNILTLEVGGKRFDIDFFDIDGVEWRDMKRATDGMLAREIMRSALLERDDFEALAALLWIWRRRTEPELGYLEVLGGLKFADFGPGEGDDEDQEEAEEADPPA